MQRTHTFDSVIKLIPQEIFFMLKPIFFYTQAIVITLQLSVAILQPFDWQLLPSAVRNDSHAILIVLCNVCNLLVADVLWFCTIPERTVKVT